MRCVRRHKMNKCLGFLCGCLFFAKACLAYTSCTGGSTIQSNDLTATFCKSNMRMSWYAAHAWCRQNGGVMATFEKMCPGVSFGSTCANMSKGSNYDYWGYVNLCDGTKNGRINLNTGSSGKTSPINRPVEGSLEGDGKAIKDMYALCE